MGSSVIDPNRTLNIIKCATKVLNGINYNLETFNHDCKCCKCAQFSLLTINITYLCPTAIYVKFYKNYAILEFTKKNSEKVNEKFTTIEDLIATLAAVVTWYAIR